MAISPVAMLSWRGKKLADELHAGQQKFQVLCAPPAPIVVKKGKGVTGAQQRQQDADRRFRPEREHAQRYDQHPQPAAKARLRDADTQHRKTGGAKAQATPYRAFV